MRRAVKGIAEHAIGSTVAARRFATLLDVRVAVLAFHNVVPDSERIRGDRSLHLPLSRFLEIVDWLPEIFDVVSLEGVLEGVSTPKSGPRAVITFDDAYAGAVSLAIPELVRRGLPATVFAVAGSRDGQTFWWDALSDPADGLSARVRELALTTGLGRESEIRILARENGWKFRELGGPFVAARWRDLEAECEAAGICVAHHTRTHANAAVLDRSELLGELRTGRRELEQRLPAVKPLLAWPYGRSSARARAVAMEVGYEAAFRVDGGTWRAADPPPSRFRFPRLNVPSGLSLKGFRLRAVGLLGR